MEGVSLLATPLIMQLPDPELVRIVVEVTISFNFWLMQSIMFLVGSLDSYSASFGDIHLPDAILALVAMCLRMDTAAEREATPLSVVVGRLGKVLQKLVAILGIGVLYDAVEVHFGEHEVFRVTFSV